MKISKEENKDRFEQRTQQETELSKKKKLPSCHYRDIDCFRVSIV